MLQIYIQGKTFFIFLLANILLPTYSQIFCEWHLSFRLVKNFHARETNQGKEKEISKCIVH